MNICSIHRPFNLSFRASQGFQNSCCSLELLLFVCIPIISPSVNIAWESTGISKGKLQFQFCFSAGTPFQDLVSCSLGCFGSPKLFLPHPTMRLSQAPGHCFQLSLFSPQGRISTFPRRKSRGKCRLTL